MNPAAFWSDGLRFAFGTLTVFPVAVRRWDRGAARAGMTLAPVAGLAVGLLAAATGLLLLVLGASPLLAAVASAAVPAVLTRGLHLDGLADTADGLGSGKPAEDALRIMKQSDIGPFGVITLLFVLLGQVAALSQAYGDSWARGPSRPSWRRASGGSSSRLRRAWGFRPRGPRGWGRRWRGWFLCGVRFSRVRVWRFWRVGRVLFSAAPVCSLLSWPCCSGVSVPRGCCGTACGASGA